jgi:hypothetical protein
MHFPHGPGGFGMFGGVIESVIAGLFFIVCFAIVVGLLFVLVRFLLVATKAAELYVARNSAAAPAEPVASAPVTTAPTPVATTTSRTRATKPPTT